MEDSGNDQFERRWTIRDMVQSISKIPDRIQREVYVQECARIMQISEDVLFNTLAQLGKKISMKRIKPSRKIKRHLKLFWNEKTIEKVD